MQLGGRHPTVDLVSLGCGPGIWKKANLAWAWVRELADSTPPWFPSPIPAWALALTSLGRNLQPPHHSPKLLLFLVLSTERKLEPTCPIICSTADGENWVGLCHSPGIWLWDLPPFEGGTEGYHVFWTNISITSCLHPIKCPDFMVANNFVKKKKVFAN